MFLIYQVSPFDVIERKFLASIIKNSYSTIILLIVKVHRSEDPLNALLPNEIVVKLGKSIIYYIQFEYR